MQNFELKTERDTVRILSVEELLNHVIFRDGNLHLIGTQDLTKAQNMHSSNELHSNGGTRKY